MMMMVMPKGLVSVVFALILLAMATAPSGTTALMLVKPPRSFNQLGINRRTRRGALIMMPHHPSRHCGKRSNLLSMHMGGLGHSHSHDHAATASSASSSSSSHQRQSELRQQKTRRRRRLAMFLFCALAILGPPLFRGNHRIREADVACFSVTVTALLMVDPVRRQVKAVLQKLRDWSSGISKHAPTPGFGWQAVWRINENAADRVTVLGGVLNLLLSGGKFAVGVACHSSALIADAGHSLSDLFSDFVTLWAVQVGRLPPDEDHPYGHGKFEAIGSLFLSLTLLVTGLSVGAVSNRKLLEIIALQRQGDKLLQSTVAIPGALAMFMAALSIVSKEWLYRITRRVGERLKSQVVIANAWHHRSDAYSSVLALGSIGLARYVPGLIFADAAAGLFVAGMICMTGAEILGESIKQLTDSSNDELAQQVTALAERNNDVASVVRVRTRQVGSSSTVDLSVSMPDDRPAFAARAVEEKLKQQILRETDSVVDIDVRATTGTGIICPLLEAKVNSLGNSNQTSVGDLLVSAEEVDSCVRDEIRRRHPDVCSVERVRVNYQDSLHVNVDVDIRIDPASSIQQAGEVAEGLRQTLESSNQINKASIFLDLNAATTDVAASSSSSTENQLA